MTRVQQWFTGAGPNSFADWQTIRQNSRGDMVSLSAQRANSLSAHPLLMGVSIRAVGFVRPNPPTVRPSLFTRNTPEEVEIFDLIGLESEGIVLGDEEFGIPIGVA